jgi:CubicO group peptidase (beta-lactamase class C family)
MGVIAIGTGSASTWRSVAPEAAGLDPAIDERLEQEIASGAITGLHGLLVVRRGAIAFERYFTGEDARWGEPLGAVAHGPDPLHDMRSVTKSITGLLYGQALADGLVPPVRARLAECLPEYSELYDDPLKKRITIGQVLAMRMGIDWQEDLSYDDPANSEIEMEAAPDRVRYVLSRPMAARPGSAWTYCGGATALLGHLIARGVGEPLSAYAARRLFQPLGIAAFDWIKGHDGVPVASSGLRLSPRDLARIGQMVLDHGRGIVPADWLAQSFRPRGPAEGELRYGYQWWLGRLLANGKPWVAAYGNGGQRLIVIPSLAMAVVIVAGNYNRTDQWKMPARLMSSVVMASLRAGAGA